MSPAANDWDAFQQLNASNGPYHEPLALWTWRHLVNRTDAYVRYRALHRRFDGRKMWTVRSTPLDVATLKRHFIGHKVEDVVALHAISRENTCRWVAVDLDCHADDPALASKNCAYAVVLANRLLGYGFRPLVLDSDGRGGFHLLVLFSEPVDASVAFSFVHWLTADWACYGVGRPDLFPRHRWLAPGKVGFALRLLGRHHTRPHWTGVLTPAGPCSGPAAVQAVLSTSGVPPMHIPSEARSYELDSELLAQTVMLLPGQTVEDAERRKAPPAVTYSSPHEALAEAYRFLAGARPSVQGQQGDIRCWKLACAFFFKFPSLAPADAMPPFREWNSRCLPAFSEAELWDKLQRAHRYAAGRGGAR